MYALYAYNCILAGPDPIEIDDIRKLVRKLDITEERNLEDFLGLNIDMKLNGTIHLTQSYLIDNILGDLDLLGEGVKTKTTPASHSKILKKNTNSDYFDNLFHYRSVIGKLSYLERGSQSDAS